MIKYKKGVKYSTASSMFHWTVSFNFLAMYAADDKTDFWMLYTIGLILALSLMISLMFSRKCMECPPTSTSSVSSLRTWDSLSFQFSIHGTAISSINICRSCFNLNLASGSVKLGIIFLSMSLIFGCAPPKFSDFVFVVWFHLPW